MKRALGPEPVSAMLPKTLLSEARTLHLSFTIPVFGSHCSQKYWKLAFSICSRKVSSPGDKYVAGGRSDSWTSGATLGGTPGFWAAAAPVAGRDLHPVTGMHAATPASW